MKRGKKSVLLEQFKKTPVIEVACQKVGVSRATYYRWCKEDPEFAQEAEFAINEGSQVVNDMAESKLIGAIKDGNMTGIIFWLKNHHRNYAPKLEVTTKNGDIPLTEEQKELIRKSLAMAFVNKLENEENKDGKQ